ncbi:MAG: GDP-mannose 4,6-dehydratase [Chloroflexota bacterium]
MTRALITGVTGQDGRYLAGQLAASGIEVWGAAPGSDRASLPDGVRPAPPFDLRDGESVRRAVAAAAPALVFHLAAQSSVSASVRDPLETADVTGAGTARVLEAVRVLAPAARVFIAGSSEMFGSPGRLPQREDDPILPVTPYGAAKAYAHHLARAYRESYGMFVCSGILFSHESPLRGEAFVTGKIVAGAVAIAAGERDELALGTLEARRDWSFAGDVTRAMALMLAAPEPGDYVIASGVSHSVADWCERAFGLVGLDWRQHVRSDPALLRPGEAIEQRGDSSRARERLGWRPEVDFESLVNLMVEAELARRATG